MRYAVMTLLVLACLQAARGEFMAALCFLVIAPSAYVAWRKYGNS